MLRAVHEDDDEYLAGSEPREWKGAAQLVDGRLHLKTNDLIFGIHNINHVHKQRHHEQQIDADRQRSADASPSKLSHRAEAKQSWFREKETSDTAPLPSKFITWLLSVQLLEL